MNRNPIRVLLITTDIDRSESSLFRGLQRSGVEVHAICNPEESRYLEISSTLASVTPLSIHKRFQRSAIRVIREKLREHSFDIVHVLRKQALSNTLPALKNHNCRLIAYRGIVGNISFWDPFSWMTFLNPRIDRVICVAEAIREFFLQMRFFSYRLPRGKFVTIYKGHDIEWYRSTENISRYQLGISDNSVIIGCVASMRPRKGIPILIKAFDRLVSDPRLHLVLVGPVKDSKIIKARDRSLARDRIHLLGFKKDAATIAGAFDLFVMPSLSREGLPRSLLESMSQQVPAVVTNIGGSPEVIVDYECGRIVPPGDIFQLANAIQYCIEDPIRHKELSFNAQTRVKQKFNIEFTIQKTRELYEELLQ